MSTHTQPLLWRLGVCVCVVREQMSPMLWCKEICQLNAILFRFSLSPPFFYFGFQFPNQKMLLVISWASFCFVSFTLCRVKYVFALIARTNVMLFKCLPRMQMQLSTKYVGSRRTEWCSAEHIHCQRKWEISNWKIDRLTKHVCNISSSRLHHNSSLLLPHSKELKKFAHLLCKKIVIGTQLNGLDIDNYQMSCSPFICIYWAHLSHL